MCPIWPARGSNPRPWTIWLLKCQVLKLKSLVFLSWWRQQSYDLTWFLAKLSTLSGLYNQVHFLSLDKWYLLSYCWYLRRYVTARVCTNCISKNGSVSRIIIFKIMKYFISWCMRSWNRFKWIWFWRETHITIILFKEFLVVLQFVWHAQSVVDLSTYEKHEKKILSANFFIVILAVGWYRKR